MMDADLVVVVSRKLDYQLGYGSPAVFPNARVMRIADTTGELVDNRRGDPELLADASLALDAIVEAAGNRAPSLDTAWAEGLRAKQRERAAGGRTPPPCADGRIYPSLIFDAIAEQAPPDYIAVADGGNLLASPASASPRAPTWTRALSTALASGCPSPSPRRSPSPTER